MFLGFAAAVFREMTQNDEIIIFYFCPCLKTIKQQMRDKIAEHWINADTEKYANWPQYHPQYNKRAYERIRKPNNFIIIGAQLFFFFIKTSIAKKKTCYLADSLDYV